MMLLLGLAVLYFCFFTLFGKAFLEALQFRMPVLRSWLIAPTVGFSLIEILICFFNQFCNLPVSAVVVWMTLAIAIASLAVLYWRRPIFPTRQILPFGAVLTFSVLYTGWPAFIHGFNWLSYVNGDMTYFSAGAVRLLGHPFYAMPPLHDLLGRDYTQTTWWSHILGQIRCGGEMLLAWSAGATRLNPIQAYMPLLLALQLAQLCAAGALALARPHFRRAALLTVGILTLSPLFSLGTFYQLLPQDCGIPAMLVLAILLTTEPKGVRQALPYCVLLAVVLSGLILHYPEITAFGVLSAFLFHLLRIVRGGRISRLWLASVALAPLLVVVMIRGALLTGIVNTLTNLEIAALTKAVASRSLFPHFMVPSGVPTWFGLLPIGPTPSEPMLSALILVGFVLLVATLVRVAIDLRAGYPYAAMLAFMLALAAKFFHGSNDYGLFKVAMFSQPALACCMAFLFSRAFKRWWWVAPVFMFAGTANSHLYQASASAALASGGVIEVPGASSFGLIFNVPKIVAISDIDLLPAEGLAAIVFRGSQVLYPSMVRGKFLEWYKREEISAGTGARSAGSSAVVRYRKPEPDEKAGLVRRAGFILPASSRSEVAQLAQPRPQPLVASDHRGRGKDPILEFVKSIRLALGYISRRYAVPALELERERDRRMNRLETLWSSEFYNYPPGLLDNRGEPTHLLTFRTAYLLNATSRLGSFADYGMFRLVPYRDVRNWLVYTPSTRGPDYYVRRWGAAFYQPAQDPYYPAGFISAVGRFILLEVLHPSDRLRVRMSLTRSILGAHQVLLPTQAIAEGESNVRLPFVGGGAATVYSEPISPLWKDGHAFIAIDFGQGLSAFPNDKTGLMRLYNREWAADDRRLIGFARDISAVSEDEYSRLTRPTRITSFPDGLLGAGAPEYSGVYEDGWISDESFVKLGASGPGNKVTIKGMIPALGTLASGRLKVVISINDEPGGEEALRPGEFRLAAPIHLSSAITTVHIRFSDRVALPGNDGRLVSAQIRSLGIE
jgi:hypothetical protein